MDIPQTKSGRPDEATRGVDLSRAESTAVDDVVTPPPGYAPPHVESARGVISAYLKATRANQLYPRLSKIRKDHMAEFAAKLAAHVAAHGQTDLRFRQTKITWGDEVIYEETNRQKSLAFKLFINGVRNISIMPGPGIAEAEQFVEVLTRSVEKEATGEDLRTAVWEAGLAHVQFSLIDDIFTSDEEKAFAEFMDAGAFRHATAATARDENQKEEAALARLADPPAFAQDEAAAFRLTREDDAALAADVDAERTRDLFAEFSKFLVEELESDSADAAQAQFAEFIEHVLASGELLRAARFLKSIRDIAASTADLQRRRLLLDVVERVGRSRIVPKIRPLVPTLVEEDREALMLLLTAVGEPAIESLCDLLDTAAKEAALDALRALAPRHPKALLPFLTDTRPAVVRTVMKLLAETGSPETASGFLPALRHPDVGVRREAIRALAKFGGRQATDVFLAALEDSGYEVRALALAALADSGDPKAVRPLLERVESSSFHALTNYEKRETFRTIGRIGSPEAVTALIRILNTTSVLRRAKTDEIRALAAAALGIIGTQPAQHALSMHQKDRSEDVRRAVAAALRPSSAVRATQAAPPPRPTADGD